MYTCVNSKSAKLLFGAAILPIFSFPLSPKRWHCRVKFLFNQISYGVCGLWFEKKKIIHRRWSLKKSLLFVLNNDGDGCVLISQVAHWDIMKRVRNDFLSGIFSELMFYMWLEGWRGVSENSSNSLIFCFEEWSIFYVWMN